jgi:hypothetical protein
MSEMLDRYNKSTKLRPEQARQIPGLAVNFIDQTNEFQNGFTTKHIRGNPTTFTQKALDYYDDELKTMQVPLGFAPVEQGIQLNRWNPKTKYYTPGQHPG